jgi:hypothetical protein
VRVTTERVLQELRGGLWHTTHPDRFKQIITTGFILPEPDLPESERWGTVEGRDHYPYVRFIGGVSLFDFDGFDSYRERCPESSWAYFVPFHLAWECAVWVELDREIVAPHMIYGADLVAKWKADQAYGHRIMAEIEVAHLGPIPRRAFKRAFLVRKGDDSLHELECLGVSGSR